MSPTSAAGARDESFVLAVDLGTGGPKVGLVSLVGQIVWQDHMPVVTHWLGEGGAEQDAEEWWTLIADACRRGLVATGIAPASVVAVGVTSQYASIVPVDEDGKPTGPCVMWMDTRGGADARRAVGGPVAGYAPVPAALWLLHAGAPPSTAGDDTWGHLAWLSRTDRAARWFLEPVDYLTMRFTGVAAATPASMSAAWLTDTRHLERCAYDPALLRRSPIDARRLPPLRPTGSWAGEVTAEAAGVTGLVAGTPVVCGLPDLHSAAVGAGAVGDYEAHLVISTTSWLSCPVAKKKTDVAHSIATVPGITPDRYVLIDNQDTAGRCFEWLRDGVIAPPDGLFPGATAPSYEELTALAATVPAGSDRVLFTPWLSGERTPISDRHARAGFHNLSLATTRAHLVRAVLEGVAMNARWLVDVTEAFTKRRLDPIRLIGGGAQSELWCQIVADVTDRTIEQVSEPLGAHLRGIALFAGIALGRVERSELRSLVSVAHTFRPTPQHRAIYDQLYAEFPVLYAGQKKTFARLNRTR